MRTVSVSPRRGGGTVALRLGKKRLGGAFATHDDRKIFRSIQPTYFSVVINNYYMNDDEAHMNGHHDAYAADTSTTRKQRVLSFGSLST